jgi:hypothetical protein
MLEAVSIGTPSTATSATSSWSQFSHAGCRAKVTRPTKGRSILSGVLRVVGRGAWRYGSGLGLRRDLVGPSRHLFRNQAIPHIPRHEIRIALPGIAHAATAW